MGKLTCHCCTSVDPLPGQRAEEEPEPYKPCLLLCAPQKVWVLPWALWGDAALQEACSHIISVLGSPASLTEPLTTKLVHFSNPSIVSCICTSISSVPKAGLTLGSNHLHPPLGLGFTPFGGSLGHIGLRTSTRDHRVGLRDPLGTSFNAHTMMHETPRATVCKMSANRRLPRAAWNHLSKHVAADLVAAELPTESEGPCRGSLWTAGGSCQCFFGNIPLFWMYRKRRETSARATASSWRLLTGNSFFRGFGNARCI